MSVEPAAADVIGGGGRVTMDDVALLAPRPAFIGRRAELDALLGVLDDAAAGRPAVVLVGGDSGVGKTRLLEELRAQADDSHRVLVGRCVELGEAGLPFAAPAAALRPLVRAADPVLEQLPASTRRAMAGLLPELDPSGAEPLADDAQAQSLLFEAMLGLLARLAAEAPVLLILEDLHWADTSTRHLVAFLARNLAEERLALIASYRTDELHRRHPLRPLLARLESDLSTRRIELEPFTVDEVGALTESIRGSSDDAQLVSSVHRRSGGNALFAEELLTAETFGCYELPDTLRELLLTRIEDVDAATQHVLRAAAVIDRPFGHRLLQAVTGMGDAELLAAVREAVNRNLLVVDDDDNYVFRHALVGEAINADALPAEHADLHAVAARALEADSALLGDVPPATLHAELAWHHRCASQLAPALHHSTAAGRAAIAGSGVHEALRHLERALELWPRVPDAEAVAGCPKHELLDLAADAALLSGDARRAVTHAKLALDVVDPETDPVAAAVVRTELGKHLRQVGEGENALAMYREALALLGDQPSAERVDTRSAIARVYMLGGIATKAARHAREAVDEARAVGAHLTESRALETLGVATSSLGDPETGIAALRESLAIVEELGQARPVSYAAVNLSDVLRLEGRVDEALAVVRGALERLRADGMEALSYYFFTSLQELELLMFAGDWDAVAERLPPLDRGPSSGTGATFLHLLHLELAIGRGDWANAERAEARMSELTRTAFEGQWIVPRQVGTATLALVRGDHARARAAIGWGLDALAGIEDAARLARLIWMGLRIEADAAELGRARGRDGADAATLADLTERLAALPSMHRREARGWVALARAELTRAAGDPAPAAWEAALGHFEAASVPWPLLYARFRTGEAALAAGDRAAARAALHAASSGARRLGARALEDEIHSLARRGRIELAAAPEEPAAAASEDGLGLTRREREVLALVAEGLTNRQIGAKLYMSEKTASVHVSRILAKLDVSGRVEAAAVAHRLGLTALS